MDKEMTSGDDRIGRLVRLEETKNFDIADGSQDIRGWNVRTADGRNIGKVEELIVDLAAKRVRYMDVKIDGKALGIEDDRHILVPIGAAQLNEDKDDVVIDRLPAGGIAGVPVYSRGPITPSYETSVRDYYEATGGDDPENYYGHELYDENRLRKDSAHRRDTKPDLSAMTPKFGDNEVTLPLTDDQEVIIRRPGSDQEMVIRKSTAPDRNEGERR